MSKSSQSSQSSFFKKSFDLCSSFSFDHYAFLLASGKDARSFLHSITTCDLNNFHKGSILPAAILDRKGQLLFLFYIFCIDEDCYSLFTNEEEVTALENCLSSFLFSERVVLNAYRGQTSIIFANDFFDNFFDDFLKNCPALPAFSSAFSSLSRLKNFSFSVDLSENPMMVFRIDAIGEPCLFFFSPSFDKLEAEVKIKISDKKNQIDQFFNLLEDWHKKQNINFSKKDKALPCDFPSMCFDAGFFLNRECFPLGVLFNQLEKNRCFIAMTKGCYPGQEVVERIKTQNKLATHRLCALLFSEKDYEIFKKNVSPKEQIFFDNQLVGEVIGFTFSFFYQRFVVAARLTRKIIKTKTKFSPAVNDVFYGEAEIKNIPFYTETNADRFLKKQYEAAMKLFHGEKYAEVKKNLLPIADDKGMSCEKTYPEILEMLAVVAEKLDDRKKAIEYNRLFSYYDPDAVMPHTNLSRLLMLDGLIESAEKEKGIATMKQFRKGSSQSGEENEAEKKAAIEAKKKMFLNILAQDDSEEIALFSLGKLFFEEKDYVQAKKNLEKLTSINENHSLGWAFLSKSLLQLGEEALAKKSLEKGMIVAKKQGEMLPLKSMEEDYAKISKK